MNISRTLTTALLVSLSVFAVKNASAQTGRTGAFGQQNQQTQSPFGNQSQSAFGQQGGQQRTGQVGGQAANRGQQQVGGRDGFVGSDADQVRTQQLSGRQQRRQLFDLAVESLNEMRESRRERNARRNAPAPVRVQLRPLFQVQAPNPAEMTTRLQANLQRTMPNSAAGTMVSVEGSTATLAGTVTNEYESKLAAKIVSLTPGINQVNNQLAIEPTSTGP